jgi:hypothetical protein
MTPIKSCSKRQGNFENPSAKKTCGDITHHKLRIIEKYLRNNQHREAFEQLNELDETESSSLNKEFELRKKRLVNSNFIPNTDSLDTALIATAKHILLPAVQTNLFQSFPTLKQKETLMELQNCEKRIKDKIYFSGNFPDRGNLFSDYFKKQHPFIDYRPYLNPLADYYKKIRACADNFQKLLPKKISYISYVKSHESFASFFGVGNCPEISATVFSDLQKTKKIKRIEFIQIKNGNHVLVVVNRKFNSDINDISSWGKNCWCIDLWAETNTIYPSYDIPLYLRAFLSKWDDKGIPLTENFDPQKHSISVLTSTLFSVEEFIIGCQEATDDVYEWFLKELTAFHQASSEIERTEIAKTIAFTHPKSQDAYIKQLIFQMKQFLDPDYGELYNLNSGEKKYTSAEDFYEKAQYDSMETANFISSLHIDYMLKVVKLMQQGKVSTALNNFLKLPATFTAFIGKNAPSDPLKYDLNDAKSYTWMTDALIKLVKRYAEQATAIGKPDMGAKIQKKLDQVGKFNIAANEMQQL